MIPLFIFGGPKSGAEVNFLLYKNENCVIHIEVKSK